MSTSPRLLRGVDVPAARMDSDLRTSPWAAHSPLSRYGADPRLVDTRLEPAFDELVVRAETAARAEGFALGLAEGRAAASAELAQSRLELAAEHDRRVAEDRELVGHALAALDVALQAWETRIAPAQLQLEGSALDLALEIVRELAGHVPEVIEHAVARTLSLTDDVTGEILLRLHPSEADRMAPVLQGRAVRLVPDPSVEPGGCLAEVSGRRVDARLSTTLRRLREALS